MRLTIITGLLISLAPSPLLAQSMMMPLTPAAPPAAAEEAPAASPAARAKPKPSKPRAPAAIAVVNNTTTPATEIVITAEDKSATLSKPLAPRARTSMKLPKMKGCVVSVAATFEGEGQVDAGEFNVCKEKVIRFTE